MLIDWFTVAAQVFNFLVLVYLLKRFLYGPITRAMDQREQRIADRLQEAEAKRSEAESEAEEYRRKNRELEEQRGRKLQEIDGEAEERRKELLAQTRAEVEGAREEWIETVQRERDVFAGELRKKTGSEVLRVARKVLGDLTAAPNDPLGARLTEVFVQRLETLGEDEKQKLAATAEGQAVVVRAPFDLTPALQRQVSAAVRSICGDGSQVSWQTEPDLALGVELSVEGFRLAWGVDRYLDALEESVAAVLDQASSLPAGGKETRAATKAKPKALKEPGREGNTEAAGLAGKPRTQALEAAAGSKPARATPVDSRDGKEPVAGSPADGAEPEPTAEPEGGAVRENTPPVERKPARDRKPPKKGKPRRKGTS